MNDSTAIDVSVAPSGTGCAECEAAGGWWVHLRRCAACGHIGCCDTSPGQHATAHYQSSGHPLMRSFEPDEDWYWDYRSEEVIDGPDLRAPGLSAGRADRARSGGSGAGQLAGPDPLTLAASP